MKVKKHGKFWIGDYALLNDLRDLSCIFIKNQPYCINKFDIVMDWTKKSLHVYVHKIRNKYICYPD